MPIVLSAEAIAWLTIGLTTYIKNRLKEIDGLSQTEIALMTREEELRNKEIMEREAFKP